MNLIQKLHCLHRFWRYRLVTEKESIDFLRSLNLKNTTCIDIGANKGAYTYWLAKAAGESGQVMALEPQPELAPYLKDLISTFGLKNTTLINKAASRETTNLHMLRKHIGHGGARITGKTDQSITIESITLDSLLASMKHPVSYIKCDVEGHELQVLKGAESLIRMHQPIIQVEIHHEAMLRSETVSFLASLGYFGWFFIEKHRIPLARFDQYPYPRSDNHRNYFFQCAS